MMEGPDIARIAALLGDPARANMLATLMSGMALTAGELAREARVSPQTASSHLAKLREAGLIVITLQGRHRYASLAGPEVAATLESLMGLAARTGHLRSRPGPRDEAMRFARVCYDHLAGRLGVAMHDAFIAQELLVSTAEGLAPTPRGRARFEAEGIDLKQVGPSGRPTCRICLDWSERRPHLAGPLAAQLLQAIFRRGWATRAEGGRIIRFSSSGLSAFERFLAAAKQDQVEA
jgi:DNA-binding transcriptional ArsR family regulator